MTILEQIDRLKYELLLFDNWLDRYQYIIDLGKNLPEFPLQYRTNEYLLRGCQANVWFIHSIKERQIHFSAFSDAMIVAGLIAIILRLFNQRSDEEIIGAPISLFAQLGIAQHLSLTRNNGLHAMLSHIKKIAEESINNNKN